MSARDSRPLPDPALRHHRVGQHTRPAVPGQHNGSCARHRSSGVESRPGRIKLPHQGDAAGMLGRPVHRQDDATARPAGVLLPIFQLGRHLHDMGELIPVGRYEDVTQQAITDDYPVRHRAEDQLPWPQNWTGGHQVNNNPTCLSTLCCVPPIPSMLPAMIWQRTRQRPELQLPQVGTPPQQEPPPSEELVAEEQEEATEERKGYVKTKWSALHEGKGPHR